jgi:hypothetical protein
MVCLPGLRVGVLAEDPQVHQETEGVMGWSCRADAHAAMRRVDDACHRLTGTNNTFLAEGRKWFYEIDREEYEDGRITGVYLLFEGENLASRIGTFVISPDGRTMSGGHKWMRDAMAP